MAGALAHDAQHAGIFSVLFGHATKLEGKPYGTPIFCSVAVHRDTGLSRGYAFVSFNNPLRDFERHRAGQPRSRLYRRSVESVLVRGPPPSSLFSAAGYHQYEHIAMVMTLQL